jgi:ferredoxin
MRYRGGECTLCRDACPTGALTLDDGPVLDQGRCRAAHLCRRLPAEVLHHEAARDRFRLCPGCRTAGKRRGLLLDAPGADTLRLEPPVLPHHRRSVHIAALASGTCGLIHGNCAACAW